MSSCTSLSMSELALGLLSPIARCVGSHLLADSLSHILHYMWMVLSTRYVVLCIIQQSWGTLGIARSNLEPRLESRSC